MNATDSAWSPLRPQDVPTALVVAPVWPSSLNEDVAPLRQVVTGVDVDHAVGVVRVPASVARLGLEGQAEPVAGDEGGEGGEGGEGVPRSAGVSPVT
jgi:hypothetical protein